MADAAAQESKRAVKNSAAVKPLVLLIDDSADLTAVLARTLETAGFRTTAFNQGLLGLKYLSEPLIGSDRPSAAILDIHLPDISGLVLALRAREVLGPDAPIVMLSGDASLEVLNSLPHVGATHFFRKPVSSTQLLEKLKGLLS